jgi:hypothetical protein
MGGGGKGGSQSTQVEIPAWAESKMRENLNKASAMGEIGYMPYYGPEVAAFTPLQEAGMQGAYDAAAAFGLAPAGGDALAGIPEAETFAGGIRGYSSGDLFEQARAEFEARNPQQAAAYNRFFVPYGVPEEGAGGGGYGPYGRYGGAGGYRGGVGGYTGPFGGNIPNIPPVGTPEFDEWLRRSGIDPSTMTV